MKISYNWLKEFIDLKISPQMLAQKLTMAGLEVTSFKKNNKDWVMEIEITSNRADWLSHLGVAREIAAILGKKLKAPKILKLKPANKENLEIEILDKKACPFYTARLIKNVTIKDSPEFIKEKLESTDLNLVNSAVDVTNFLIAEMGQPLHAFDFDTLSGRKLIVRRAKNNEKITAIDAKTYTLDPEILVIADGLKPVAIAGIMGSKDTEVTNTTKNILLESAYFDPLVVRRASRKLGLISESSYRFERCVDLTGVDLASLRAVNLIKEIAGGNFVAERICKNYLAKKPTIISLNTEKVSQILGKEISLFRQKIILQSLGLEIKAQKDNLKVKIPSYRPDLKQDVDLIEEIARIFGYENIKETLPFVQPQQKIFDTFMLTKEIKNILISQNLNEIITYSLVNITDLEKTDSLENALSLKNPLSNDFCILRPNFIPGFLKAINYNLNRKEKNLRFFEIGKVFTDQEEELGLGISLLGNDYEGVIPEGKTIFSSNILHLKGIVELLLERLGIKEYVFLKLTEGKNFVQDSGLLLQVRGQDVGFLGKISQKILNNFDIKPYDIYFAGVSLEKLLPFINFKREYAKINPYPVISRDVSLVMEQKINVTELIDFLQIQAKGLLTSVGITDSYLGKHIPAGSKGITLSLSYQAKDHTLSLEELNPLHQALCQNLIKKYNLTIR